MMMKRRDFLKNTAILPTIGFLPFQLKNQNNTLNTAKEVDFKKYSRKYDYEKQIDEILEWFDFNKVQQTCDFFGFKSSTIKSLKKQAELLLRKSYYHNRSSHIYHPPWFKTNIYDGILELNCVPEICFTYEGYKKTDTIINQLLSSFNFTKIKFLMEYLEWQWASCGYPDITDLSIQSERLLTHLLKDNLYYTACGGLAVGKLNDNIYLEFVVEDWYVYL